MTPLSDFPSIECAVPSIDQLKELTDELLALYYVNHIEQMRLVVRTVVDQVPKFIEQMNLALSQEDRTQARSLVHTFKPALPMVGLNEMHRCAEQLEVILKTPHYDHRYIAEQTSSFCQALKKASAVISEL